MLVRISSYKWLQDGGCHLEYQCYYTDLTERESVFVFDYRIYGRYDGLHHVIQQMRETYCQQD